ncbi:DUF1611 domain-containing protein [Candidatus Sumerlaeota bacterium]|nr:DUF1611 domain-containing protein [Candidatus Sumerlaeota bacterium]
MRRNIPVGIFPFRKRLDTNLSVQVNEVKRYILRRAQLHDAPDPVFPMEFALAMSRIVLLTEGHSNPDKGKTAAAILRYRTAEVVGVIDSTQAGKNAGELFGAGGDIRVGASLDEFNGDELMVGVAPAGLKFPPAWRKIILDAISRGMNVTSGVHTFLGEDPEIAAAAKAKGIRLWDVRTPPPDIGTSIDAAKDAKPLRVHTVGLDCSVGKMTVSIEIDRALRERGVNSRFIATGQTGIMVSGYGLPIDRIISDFVAGAAERLVMENQDREVLSIEGQGSLFHPLFSGVTLGLLHGSAPDFLILCSKPTRKCIVETQRPMPTLSAAMDIFTRCANFIHPCKIIGIGVNTYGLDVDAAQKEIEKAETETGLPATDVFRFGVEKLVEAILKTPRVSTGAMLRG